MRILAVRGANLASLGSFSVELDRPPLVDSRIFAIVGPTGAGKSTLLDAICLALYDRVPRLLDARDAGVGTDDLSPNDPRALMRRGAVEAFAEVDFVDRQGTRCRARWDCWRARKRADGRVQTQRVGLTDLDAKQDLTEGTRTETLRQIEGRLGLSFDEFRRAVLLAQGDFAAFLRAPADERAHLLEKMTGTHLFGALSRAAHAGCREAADALTRVEAEMSAVEVLGDEQVSALHAERQARAAARAAHAARRAEVEATLRWHDELRRAADADAEARRTLAQAQVAAQIAAAERETLERAEAAEPLRAPFEAHERAAATAVEAAERRAAAERDQTEAEAAVAAAGAQLQAAEARLAEDQTRRATDAADLARARDLDGRVAEARTALADARARLDRRAREATTARASLDAHLDRYETSAETLRRLEEWLDHHASLRPVAGQWANVRPTLERGADLLAQAAEAAGAVETADRHLERLRADRKTAAEQLDAANDALAGAKTQLGASQAALADVRRRVPPRERRAAIETIADLRAGLERLKALVPNARRLERRVREEERARKVALKHAKEARRQLEEARRQQKAARAGLESMTAEVTSAEAVLAVAQRRAELLTPGEPCPLCGSTEHPAAHTDPPDNPKLSSMRARRTRYDNELTQAKEQADSARAAARTHRAEARDAQARAEAAVADQQVLLEAWSAGRDALKLVWLKSALLTQREVHKLYLAIDESPTAKDVRAGLDGAVGALDAARADLTGWAEREDDALQAVEQQQARRDELDSQQRQAAERAADLDRRLAAAEHDRSRLEERAGAAQAEWHRALGGIAAVLDRAGVLERAREAPGATAAALAERVEAYERQRLAAEEQRDRASAEQTALDGARAENDRALGHLDDARRAADQAQARFEELQRARAECLDGRTVEAYEAEAAERARRAEADVAAARQRAADAQSKHAAALGRAQDAKSAAERADAGRRAAEATLERALAASDFTLEALTHHLREHSVEWRQRTRARLQTVADGLIRAEAQAEAAHRRLEAHRSSETPALDENGAQEALVAAQSELEAAAGAIGRIDERLQRDHEARRARARLDETVRAHRERLELWSELNAVIGSADGKKLRTFAQGLTLESLIAQANLHLAQLRPRYRLGRIPNHDMDLMVIDRDLADEPRSLSSLSGGETFLVSLALALALSTMSARNVRIESLFIDEGFGALDGEALEVALATLDQLQAEGRMIGLISHIPDLAERIGYRVEVRPTGPGTSEIRVHGG